MEIERINENTVKFFISYVDIENRGFEKEEIWYDRERSEQLFWQMMDEVNYREDFHVDGPLWIQVQALDKGLEITVTKAKISQDGEDIELPDDYETHLQSAFNEELDIDLGRELIESQELDEEEKNRLRNDEELVLITSLANFEDVIQLSHYFQFEDDQIETRLYHYNEKYYLNVQFSNELTDDEQEDILSILFEFVENSEYTEHYLEEYGKVIIKENVLSTIKKYFAS